MVGRCGASGISDTTEATIAAKGTLYDYLEREDQWHAAIACECPLLLPPSGCSSAEMPLRERLVWLAMDTLARSCAAKRSCCASQCFCSPLSRTGTERVVEKLLAPLSEALGASMRDQAPRGALRCGTVSAITAQTFLGRLLICALSEDFGAGSETRPIERQRWIQEIADVFLHGEQREGRRAATSARIPEKDGKRAGTQSGLDLTTAGT